MLLGIIGLLLLNTKRISEYVKENILFKVILMDNVPEVEIYKIQKALDAKSYVKETKYITREKAALDFQEVLGEDFVETLGENPLLPTIEVKFIATYANNDSISFIESELKEFSQIKEVYYQKNLIHLVNQNVRKISLTILFFSAFLFLIAITLINNTIRLAVYSRRFLIRTMQLVGATAGYIRKPFIYSSIIQGFIGSLVAILFVTGIIYYIQQDFSNIISLSDFKILIILFAGIILAGICLNVTSTFLAVTKYLRIKTDKLYT